MTSTPDPAQDATSQMTDYAGEVRFGVVMYGGISLAVYINGVASELYEMACATPKPKARLLESEAAATREIYRRVAWLAGNETLRDRYGEAIDERGNPPDGLPPADVWDLAWLQDLQPTRLVVDVIAGTSAGGINGIYLAKALVNGEGYAALKDLWVKEGDISLLLNDRHSYEGLGLLIGDRTAKPQSLLNSDRMYLKLLDAMRAMTSTVASPPDDGASPLVDELDLFVTTTDIAGSPVPLRTFDKVVYERRYKQYFRFGYPSSITSGGNDFAPENHPFLAFAARCTSSFPFAFEPMTLESLARLGAAGPGAGVRSWDGFFPNLPKTEVAQGRHVKRAFGDGGYLDNKPFSYVAETLSTRQASIPIERKLVYVEPSPEHIDPGAGPADQVPDALTNSLAALTSIPQYEAIREDLQAILQRNRRIERVEHLVRLGEADIEGQPDPFSDVLKEQGNIPSWSTLKLSHMIRFYGLAFLPYRRLRVYTVTDRLAERLADEWGIDRDSDHLYALRALVRAWRDANFAEEPEAADAKETVNAFLDQYDFDYRVRRLVFLLRKTDQMTRLMRKRRLNVSNLTPGASGLSESDERIIYRLLRQGYDLRGETLSVASLDRALAALSVLKSELHSAWARLRALEVAHRPSTAGRALDSTSALREGLGTLWTTVWDFVRPGPASSAGIEPSTEKLREQLRELLSLLLGEPRKDQDPLMLATVSGDEVAVDLPKDWLKASSASRTLQESVYLRAQRLLSAASGTRRTRLQEALEDSLIAMRVKRSDRDPQGDEPEANRIGTRVWEKLGKPELMLVQPGDQVIVKTADVGEAVLDTTEGSLLRHILGEYNLRFDSFDQMSFPLYYDTGTGEPSTVDVVRISPEDAPSLIDETSKLEARRKLAGTALFHFGAFLDERWRLNDIMWGRLDGAERLIRALLPMSDPHTESVRAELIERAHRAILRETLVPPGHADVTSLMCDALAEMPNGDNPQAVHDLLEQLNVGDARQRDRLAGMLASLIDEQGLVNYVREKRDVDRELDPKATLSSIARAVTITGRLLEGISDKHGGKSTALRWVARAGLMLQGLLAVSLPGSLSARWWSHGLKVLYAFELFVLAAAMLFAAPEARTFALTALGATLTVHLLSLVAGDLMRSRHAWFKVIMFCTALGIVSLAAVGALGLRNVAWQSLLCGEEHRPRVGTDVQRSVCQQLGR